MYPQVSHSRTTTPPQRRTKESNMALFKRGQIYWYKRRVPAPLQDLLGKKEMRVTLRTTDLKEAEARAAELKAEFDLL
jgi:hypothetical protein